MEITNMKYHFISIGGSIMHNLAIDTYLQGNEVTGSDDEIFEPAKSNLSKYGLLPEKLGWYPDKINNTINTVILGMHAKEDNPELIKAKELNLPIVSFPEFIYQKSINKKRIVIGGSHGKTTITSMILHVLKKLGIDADYLVGAKIPDYDVMVKLSTNAEFLVVEGDEYLTSALDKRPKFHLYHPHIALISGIAWDHFNVFPTFNFYIQQFAKFIDTIEPNGCLIYFEDDNKLKEIVENSVNKIKTTGYNTPKYEVVNNIFNLHFNNKTYPLKISGRHNMQNLYGAMMVCEKMKISNNDFLYAIQSFQGAAKRMELVKETNRVKIYRDFAHAPSKVKATVDAIREQYPNKFVSAILELHTYSSLNKQFICQYKNTLANANNRIVYFDPHAISLKNLPMLDIKDVEAAFDNDVFVTDNIEMLKNYYEKASNISDIILFMSSGDFGGMDITGI